MGYYTRYELRVVIPDDFPKHFGLPTEGTIIEELRQYDTDGAEWALTSDGSTGDSTKWYDHEEIVAEFSKQYPTCVFVLKGEGEEPGDLWVKYFRNGKKQVSNARIIYDPFDPSALN
jgi:hypothetical protein